MGGRVAFSGSTGMRQDLLDRRELLWQNLELFARLRDAHGVHDMAVEITAIEIVLKALDARAR
jgi:hypothetical protein